MVDARPQPLFGSDDPSGGDDDAMGDDSRDRGVQRGDAIVLRRDKAIRTIGDAVEHVRALMETQVARAVEERIDRNAPCVGDAAVRNTFYTLLPDSQQRTVFIGIVKQRRSWTRIRTLFGAPPYGFLRHEDAGLLRAAGIAHGRSKMAHDVTQSAASYSQFGAGQLIDDFAREYRVVPSRHNVGEDDPLPFVLTALDASTVLMQVRIRKRSREAKARMLRDAKERRKIEFPRVGDRIVVKETQRVLSLRGLQPNAATQATLHVKRVVPRAQHALTAALIVVVS
jgi:hypothetical protein